MARQPYQPVLVSTGRAPFTSLSLHHVICSYYLCFPKWPWALPFPAFGSSAKHPTLSLLQSWSALPLHLIMCPIPLGSNLPQSRKLLLLTHHGGFHAWIQAHLGQLWEGSRQAVSSSGSLICVAQNHLVLCACALLGLWRWAFDGPFAPLWWVWEELREGIIWLPPPAIVSVLL